MELLKNQTILIASKSEEINNKILSLLKDYKILKTDNGNEAAEIVLKNNIDLILFDRMLNDINIFEFSKILKNNKKTFNIPLVLLKKEDSILEDFDILTSGILDFINVPFEEKEFLIKIRFYLKFYSLIKKLNKAVIDPVTKFPNKFSLTEKLKEAFNPKLLLIKITNLHLIYKYYGEIISNEIENYYIKNIKNKIPQELLSDITIYHIDRGLYALLIEDNSNEIEKFMLFNICENFFKGQEKVIVSNKYKFELNIAIGISMTSKDPFLYSEIALDFAIEKKTGYIFAEDIIDIYISEKQNHIFWINRIKRALDEDRIIPFFQPIYNNKTKKIEKYEALLRLIDEEGNIIEPANFLHIAKLENSYFEITKRIINKTFEIFKNRSEEVSINFSFIDIENSDIYHYIFLKLKEMKDFAKRLVIELVEDENIKDYGIVKTFIYEAKQYGVKIAIDDFGSGYSNYKRIFDLNVDYVKIDGSLIKDIDTSPLSRNIVSSIKSFTEKSGIKTIAEYVANENIFQIINELNIEYSQGYYIGKPEDLTKK
ncbi:MAG TPA: EAL domain-containing protein [Spirochaetota bacterium]|nr:EAL domain-containing protein [Spirochaetota bacterium]HOL57164.1 EAL domain-containing protein [Spirochaetota bacterium]HPP04778.1 EAL domain-containing protein [Spirochaetota bacterium]